MKCLARQLTLLIWWLTSIFLLGCATYQSRVDESRRHLERREFDLALEKLKPLAETSDGDQLAYLLDYGTALHIAGKYEESIKVFLEADKLAENVDFHSVSRIAGATLFNEEMIQYKGDPFEKIFINAYLALNYLCLNKLDDALVEARRINEKIIKYNSENKANFEKNAFGKYLSALVWEADKKWDDAYIAFHEAYQIDPGISMIGEDLIRSAFRSHRMDEYKKWKTAFPEVKEDPRWYDKKLGEIVVLVEQGWGPRKFAEHGQLNPYLIPVYSETLKVKVEIENTVQQDSKLVYNVTRDAIKTLQADAGSLVARRLGSRVAKEVVADQIRQKDKALGFVAWAIMVFSERADLRQWSTLPASMQVARIYLPPGKYLVKAKGQTNYGSPTQDYFEKSVDVVAGQKSFFNIRTLL